MCCTMLTMKTYQALSSKVLIMCCTLIAMKTYWALLHKVLVMCCTMIAMKTYRALSSKELEMCCKVITMKTYWALSSKELIKWGRSFDNSVDVIHRPSNNDRLSGTTVRHSCGWRWLLLGPDGYTNSVVPLDGLNSRWQWRSNNALAGRRHFEHEHQWCEILPRNQPHTITSAASNIQHKLHIANI